MLQSSLPTFVLRHRIYRPAAGTPSLWDFTICDLRVGIPGGRPLLDDWRRKWWRGWESHPPKEVYEASLCALVEFPAVKWPAEPKLDRAKAGGVGG